MTKTFVFINILISIYLVPLFADSTSDYNLGMQGHTVPYWAEATQCSPAQSYIGFIQCPGEFTAFPKWLPDAAFYGGRDLVGGFMSTWDDSKYWQPGEPGGIEDKDIFNKRSWSRSSGPSLNSSDKRDKSLSFLSRDSKPSASYTPPFFLARDIYPDHDKKIEEEKAPTPAPSGEDKKVVEAPAPKQTVTPDPNQHDDQAEATAEPVCTQCAEAKKIIVSDKDIKNKCKDRLEFKRFDKEVPGFEPDDVSKCILRAQALRQNNEKTFVKCEDNKFNLKQDPKNRPCLTKSYHENVVDSYKQALTCVNTITSPQMSNKETIPLFAHESRFHINQYNIDGSAESVSIGQLVIATDRSNKNDATLSEYIALIQDIKTKLPELKRSSNSSCKKFNSYFSDASFNEPKRNACYLMRSEDNPEKAMIYSMLAYRAAKAQARTFVNKKLADNDPCKAGMEKLATIQNSAINSLATMAYHDGSGTVKNRFCSLIKDGKITVDQITAENFKLNPKNPGAFWVAYDKHFDKNDDYMRDITDTLAGVQKEKDLFLTGRNLNNAKKLDYEEMDDNGVGLYSGKGELKCHDY